MTTTKSHMIDAVNCEEYTVPAYEVQLTDSAFPTRIINLKMADVIVNNLNIPGLRRYDEKTASYIQYLIEACMPETINGISIYHISIIAELTSICNKLLRQAKPKYIILPETIFNMLQYLNIDKHDRLKFITPGEYDMIETIDGCVCEVRSFKR